MQIKQTEAQTAPIFLKLGGSLITDKRLAETPRLDVIQRLAAEIAEVRRQNPTLRLVIGHGSGSFGHVHAKQHGTRNGVATPAQWQGFALTADAAARLNRIVVNALLAAGIPAWAIQPSATLHCVDGRIQDGTLDQTVAQALQRGLVPLVYGDTTLDDMRGGTIASTEEIFEWLAPRLHPQRLVLAGEVDGIYTADPQLDPNAKKLPVVTPTMLQAIQAGLGASHGVDVTGGMAAKVVQAINLVNQQPGREVILCSGLIAGHVQKALSEGQATSDCQVGTRVYGD